MTSYYVASVAAAANTTAVSISVYGSLLNFFQPTYVDLEMESNAFEISVKNTHTDTPSSPCTL